MPLLVDNGFMPYSPFYTVKGQPRSTGSENVALLDIGKWDPYQCSLEDSRVIVLADLRRIRENDGVIAFISEKLSIGKIMEVFYCAYMLKKPVFIVTKKYSKHPWIVYLAHFSRGFIVPNLRRLIKELNKIYDDR